MTDVKSPDMTYRTLLLAGLGFGWLFFGKPGIAVLCWVVALALWMAYARSSPLVRKRED